MLEANVGDPPLGAADRHRPLVVGGLEAIGRPGAALERGDLPLVDDLSRSHDRHSVAHVLYLGQQVTGQQHGHALVGQTPDQQPHVPHSRRVQAGGRLVEQQQPRLAKQRRRNPQPLAHAVRVAADPVLGPAGELHRLQRGIDPAGEIGIEGRRLNEPGHPLERMDALHRVAAEQAHASLRGPDQPQHHAQRSCLARSVGPQIAVHVAGLYRQVDPGDGGQLAVALD